jgi:hypothetical protein
MITPEQFNKLLPLACAWVEEKERLILRDGLALTDTELADARKIGVKHPERVRLMSVASMPTPDHPELRGAAHAAALSPHTAGLSLRYGIFIRAEFWRSRRMVVHELVHTSQYERLGSIESFLSNTSRSA